MMFSFDLNATEAGEVRLAVVIDGEVVWPHPNEEDGSSDFDPEDVLSYLVDAWPSLLLAQSWPIRFEPDQEPRSITGLLRAAEDRWEQLSASEVESEGRLLDEFLYHHDLSQMKQGSGLESCFVLRQQRNVRVETNREVYEDVPFSAFVEELTRLGSFTVDLLKRVKGSAVRLIERWESREEIEPVTAAGFLAGLPRSDIAESSALQELLVSEIRNRTLSTIANDNSSPEYAAARSSGALGPAGVAAVLGWVRGVPDGKVSDLSALRRRVQQNIRRVDRALDQGIRAANVVRDWLGQSDDEGVNLDALSARLSIRVERRQIPDNRLDGIATSGPRHGPAILLNQNTRRQGASPDDLERSLRFTWAHEIGHLILDQSEWPALVDATRQRVPRMAETRANAFAAYLLLRQDVAYRWWEQHGSAVGWSDLEPVLNQLTQRFGLPRIAASRQLVRGAPVKRRRILEPEFRAHIINYDGPGD